MLPRRRNEFLRGMGWKLLILQLHILVSLSNIGSFNCLPIKSIHMKFYFKGRCKDLIKIVFGYFALISFSLHTCGLECAIIFLGSKITADGDCSHEIKGHLLLGRKVMTSLDSILKSSDITLPTKVHLVKAVVFPIVMFGCESWTIKKSEQQRISAF